MTDLYHVDAAYLSWREQQNGLATFEVYSRSAPFGGAFLLVAGIEQAVTFARDFHYTEADLDYLTSVRPYEPEFLEELRHLRFTGEILALPEGNIAFPNEPLMRVTAPFREAILLESALLHTVGVATLLATKASRVTLAAEGRPVTEFAFRRAQNPFVAARSAYIGGCVATSFVAAGEAYHIPVSGTVPHAIIQAFPDEETSFRAIAEAFPHYTLLLDTYDVHRAIETAVKVASDARERWGHELVAVRLDSGDLLADSRYVRQVLDEHGLPQVQVLASGELDEYRIEQLLQDGAPLDAFGVGASIGIGAGSAARGIDGGALGAIYKLVWYEHDGDPARIKLAGDKSTWPGKKQVYRLGTFAEDILQLDDEPAPSGGQQLLEPMLRDGQTLIQWPSLDEIRARAATELQRLPAPYRALQAIRPYPVRQSDRLLELREHATARYVAR